MLMQTILTDIDNLRKELLVNIKKNVDYNAVLKDERIRQLYQRIPNLKNDQKAKVGQALNALKQELMISIKDQQEINSSKKITSLDVTSDWNVNEPKPQFLSPEFGAIHPLTKEIEIIVDIFARMGFKTINSRQIDDDFNMFGALNFPEGHPARDGYDTFRTSENFIPPAHTSTMEHRILRDGKSKLEKGEPIAVVSYGRVFRNEDIDATHEHTFHQYEGMYISETANLGNMLAVLKSFFETYYQQKLKIRTQPGYFPFTEPGLELLIEKPAAIGGKNDEWLEMLGCGMTHPEVLKIAGIDPMKYRGFAWGGGIERLVMLKYGINDVRLFNSGKLEFLREF